MIGDGLAPERQHELLRIAQEAVSNAVRHAHPTNVRIVLLEEEAAHWTLSVIDDGRGMTLMPELYAQQGYGLNNMRERAGAIGGAVPHREQARRRHARHRQPAASQWPCHEAPRPNVAKRRARSA